MSRRDDCAALFAEIFVHPRHQSIQSLLLGGRNPKADVRASTS
jgi:hypothetical protein